MKKLKYIFYLLVISSIMVGCSKGNKDVKANDEVKGPKNAAEVLQKTVEYYKENPLKSITLDAKGTLMAKKDSLNNVEVDIEFNHLFNEDIVELNNSNFSIKTVYKKKPFEIDLHFFKDGSIAYSFNNSKYYDASDISQIVGIKEVIPQCTNIEEDASNTDMPNTEEPSQSQEPMPTSEVTASPNTSVGSELRISDIQKMSKRLKLKGNKEFNNREAYILKGVYSNNEIINDINGLLESNLYNLPGEYGNIYYSVYIDRETFEILGMDLDVSDVVKTISKSNENVDNIITVTVKANEVSKLEDVSVNKAGLNNFSNVWTVIQYYTNVFSGLMSESNSSK